MLYLFYGENDYQIKQAARKIAANFSDVKNLDFSDLTREILELRSLSDVLSQPSLFAQKTLFVLRGFLSKGEKKEQENLFSFLQTLEPKTTNSNIIFWEEKLDQRLKIVKWLKENAEVREFKALRSSGVTKWIAGNSTIEQLAVEELTRLHGSNLWTLENELKKLTSYAQGRKITLEDVKLLCTPSVEENIFAFTDAVALKNKKKAAELFENLLSQQQDPWYLFAMIIRQFRLLILMKSCGKLLKTHPFVVQKTKSQVRNWELPELKKIYQQLLDIDVACKTGKGDLKTELSLLLATI